VRAAAPRPAAPIARTVAEGVAEAASQSLGANAPEPGRLQKLFFEAAAAGRTAQQAKPQPGAVKSGAPDGAEPAEWTGWMHGGKSTAPDGGSA
ncbi:MAG: hypothetical protein HQL36_09755, partial [Alphaproteobacteria bacterium]|nr:hypothetical protein [Alphaproteobacteria bacterium]